MKVFEFFGDESDWVAAHDEAEARATLMAHYGISAEDVTGSYETVTECDPAKIEFFTEEYDEEAEETITQTAAEMMAGKTRPFLLGSTYG